MSELQLDLDVLDDIAARLELRTPNRDAAESVVAEISQHFDVEGSTEAFLGIVDAATAVGKTYTAAAIIDYLALTRGWSDFVMVTPGRVVRDKTIANFTAGNDRSLVPMMSSRVEVVTADTFDTLTASTVMDDPAVVKVYVLTVQALMAPSGSKARKRTHDYQESFGAAFYQRLRDVDDLVVIADEYHEYSGAKFSAAIRELEPRVTVGLTATPAKKDEPYVVYRYPLAAAIAERYVKAPTIVGRADDRDDMRTQLLDGMRIVERKREIAERNAERLQRRVNPVMLVVATDTAEADRLAAMVRDPSFEGGRYADAVLVVHSKVTEEDEPQTWEKLEGVEDPDSPVRVIVSVGMLKEGWDVKNVYVLLSTRPSVSDVLTEQVLGRGLRLPYGAWVQDVPMLNTLDVLAHEKYERLLASAGLLNETFVSHVTRAKAARDSEGRQVLVRTSTTVTSPVEPTGDDNQATVPGDPGPGAAEQPGTVSVTDIETRQRQLQDDDASGPASVAIRDAAPALRFPRLTLVDHTADFSLTEITDRSGFRELGRAIAAEPGRYLKRTTIEATLRRRPDGTLITELSQSQAVDRVEVSDEQVPIAEAKRTLVDAIMASDVVSPRVEWAVQERGAAAEIVEEFVAGLNGDAGTLLSAYLTRSTSRLLAKLATEQARFRSRPRYEARVDFSWPNLARTNTRPVSTDRTTIHKGRSREFRATAFSGWQRSVHLVNWFDSATERAVANMLDADEANVAWWVRLLRDDLPIRVADGSTSDYHPDLIAVAADGTRWVVEVKGDDRAGTADVAAKREAAQFWVNKVNANRPDGEPAWRYVLVTESDVADARSWEALLRLAGAY